MAGDDRKPDQDARVELAAGEGKELDERPLKLDKHGLPLVPQPSDFADDPLVSLRPPTHQGLKLTCHPHTELVPLPQTPRNPPNLLARLPRPHVLRRRQPRLRPPGAQLPHLHRRSLLLIDDVHPIRRPGSLALRALGKHLRSPAGVLGGEFDRGVDECGGGV